MKKRFKTKQEFISDYSEGWRDIARARGHAWIEFMDPLFGLPWDKTSSGYDLRPYPNLVTYGVSLNTGMSIDSSMLTTKPHPYEGKDFKIKVTPEESEMVQKKAFALGYKSHRRVGDIIDECKELYIYSSNMRYSWMKNDSGIYFREHKNIELTPQQFMDGDLPDRDVFDKEITYTPDSGKEKKPDAYIACWGEITTLAVWSRDHNRVIANDPREAYKYNLMSEEEFKKKHEPKLKFKEWEVAVMGYVIKVGCEEFTKVEAKKFMEYCQKIQGHKIDLKEFYVFLYTNKEALGL